MGKEAIMKKDLELNPDDIKDKDIVISLGKVNKNNIDYRWRWNLFKIIWSY